MSTDTTPRVAVIGLGRMGMHHVRACADVEVVELVAVSDQQADVAKQVAQDFTCKAISNINDLVGQIDMAVIAVSTRHHRAVAVPLLEAGIACLIEKPIAVDDDEAQAIIKAAGAGGAALAIGHIERFNPTIITLRSALRDNIKDGHAVSSFSARRLNLPSPRNYDVDAVLDLMIHDLDLMTLFLESDVASISVAPGATTEDITTHLTFDDQSTAQFQVSRAAKTQHRDLQIGVGTTQYRIDFAAKTVVEIQSSTKTEIKVDDRDALRAQLRAFAQLTQNQDSPIASGVEGAQALHLANQIRQHAGLL